MSKRQGWEFPYPASKLLEAAKIKVAHHGLRLKWWQDKEAEILAQIKAEGIEIDESVAAGGPKASTAYRQASVSIRNDLLKDMNECQEKVYEHKTKLADYEAWVEVLASQGEATQALDQADWLFFFGKK